MPRLVQAVIAPSAHTVFQDLIRLCAGIGARRPSDPAIAAGGGNHPNPRAFFGLLSLIHRLLGLRLRP